MDQKAGIGSKAFVSGCLMLLCLLAPGLSKAQNARQMTRLIAENLQLADTQYRILMRNTPADRMPRNFDPATGKFNTSEITWWTSGFYPASLLYIYEYTRDTVLLSEARGRLTLLEPMKYFKKDHDLGFLINCPFGNAYRILKEDHYKQVVLTAAETLTGRYREPMRSLQSWDSSGNFRAPVIIDNMMNLELLCWAADAIREPKYKVMAIAHAETTLKNQYRPDFSSIHVVDYDPLTGAVLQKKTAQGAADSSAWSRGQSWGLYGFNIMYRFTGETRYLEQARGIANFILSNPNMPKDLIPYWDYDAPEIPTALRDVSAASILASALLELGQYTDGTERERYVTTAAKIIVNLSGKKYRSKRGESGGFLLKHSVGAIPYKSEVDVSLTYADYYFLEAMLRFRNWYLPR